MIIKLISYSFTLIFICISTTSFATVFESNTLNGDWNNATSWTYISGPVDADGYPDEDDTLTILNSHTINIPSGFTCRFMSLTTQSTATINIISGGSFYFWTTAAIPKPSRIAVFNHNGSMTGNCELIGASKATLSGSGTFGPNIQFKISNNFTITNSASFSFLNRVYIQSGGDFILESGSSITFEEFYSTSSASILNNSGNITFTSENIFKTGQNSNVVFANYPGSTVEYTATSSTPGDFPVPQSGYYNLSITGTADCNSNFTVYEDFTNNGVFTSSGSGNLISFEGSTAQTFTGNGTSNLKGLRLNNSNGLSFTGSGTIYFDEAMETTSGTFTQNGHNIVLQSSSDNNSGLVKLSSSAEYNYVSGDFTVQRFYNGTSDGWRMVASPIQNATLADWDDEFIYCGITAGVGNYSYTDCGLFYSVYIYDETSATPVMDNGLSEITSLSFNVSNATGTLIYTSSGATTVSVTGTPEFNDVSKGVTNNNNGWNLVANPYPSTIDWSGFTTTNTNIVGNVWYAYSADASQYFSYSNNIPHTQGFWINTSLTTNLDFSVSETVGNQADFIKSSNGINLPMEVEMTNNVNSSYDFAYIISGSSYSNGFEQNSDAYKFFTPYPDYYSNIYFVDNLGNKLDRISINNNQSTTLYLDAKIGKYAHGSYNFSFSNLPQFMIGSCMILEDLHTGVITDLRADSTFSFVSDSTAPYPRFKIDISVNYDIQVSNLGCFEDSSGIVSVTGDSLAGHYFNLHDDSGIILDSIMAIQDSICFNNLSAGTYFLNSSDTNICSLSSQEIIIIEPDQLVSNFSTISDTFYIDTSGYAPVYFKNLSFGGNLFVWDFDDGNSSSEVNPTHYYSSPGLYTVTLSVFNDSTQTCNDILQKTIYVVSPLTSDVKEPKNSIGLLYFNDQVFYDLNDQPFDEINFTIFNIEGKLLEYGVINLKNGAIDLSKLAKGSYVFVISNKNQTIDKLKFIKVN